MGGEVDSKELEKFHQKMAIKNELLAEFCFYCEKRLKSGDLGNNFGKNQIAEMLFKLALEFKVPVV